MLTDWSVESLHQWCWRSWTEVGSWGPNSMLALHLRTFERKGIWVSVWTFFRPFRSTNEHCLLYVDMPVGALWFRHISTFIPSTSHFYFVIQVCFLCFWKLCFCLWKVDEENQEFFWEISNTFSLHQIINNIVFHLSGYAHIHSLFCFWNLGLTRKSVYFVNHGKNNFHALLFYWTFGREQNWLPWKKT